MTEHENGTRIVLSGSIDEIAKILKAFGQLFGTDCTIAEALAVVNSRQK